MTTTTQEKSTPPAMPQRNMQAFQQFLVLYKTEVRRLLIARKTIVLSCVHLLPIIGALVFVVWQNVDGISLFRNLTEYISLPFLLPMTAIFYGGPAIVDEVEGRTLTYLTLRPLDKSVLYAGKLLAGLTAATLVVFVPFAIFFAICAGAAQHVDMATWEMFAQISLSVVLGVCAYSSIFALFGALVARSMLGGIVYYVAVEIVLGALPYLELFSIRYYLRIIAGFSATDRMGFLEQLILDAPIVFHWWIGAAICGAVLILTAIIGAVVFRERQYHV